MSSNRLVATRDTPPTLMSRSDSEGVAPATKACASTTLRVEAGRAARSDRTRVIASDRAASWLRRPSAHGSSSAEGSR